MFHYIKIGKKNCKTKEKGFETFLSPEKYKVDS
ncbi:uncharacterized protein METZ01_LOCUS60356 [marine metagenome]|uniref:Uncharacterized protein n=1 Tax=marine metagenome TaxID=408172 RepID=A0A381STZ8_9ZZZZ